MRRRLTVVVSLVGALTVAWACAATTENGAAKRTSASRTVVHEAPTTRDGVTTSGGATVARRDDAPPPELDALRAKRSGAAMADRFFVMGTGKLGLVNAHTDEKAEVVYRDAGGSYDEAALQRLKHVFRSSADEREIAMTLRLVEVLSSVQRLAGGKPMIVLSGYRSPQYNESIRAKGAKAAAGSLHTEGLAADLALPRPLLFGLWQKIRALDCCGVGYYAKEGFLHVDVGRPRFWEATTSRVDENLSASNARLFARTDYDRYRRGDDLVVTLHSLTVPPIEVARTAHLVTDGGDEQPVTFRGGAGTDGRCITVDRSGAALRGAVPDRAARGRIVLTTCEPRSGKTPATFETNSIEVR